MKNVRRASLPVPGKIFQAVRMPGRHWLSGGPFHPRRPGIHNPDPARGIADCLKKKRYHTGLTSLIPVVLFYTDQKKEKIQIGVWPCPLALLEIFFFLIESTIVEEIHIFKFIIQPQFIIVCLGGFFSTRCSFLGPGFRNVEFIEVRIPFLIFFYLIPFIYLIFSFNVFFVVILIRFFLRFGCSCLGAFLSSGFRSFYFFIILFVIIIFYRFLRRRFCSWFR